MVHGVRRLVEWEDNMKMPVVFLLCGVFMGAGCSRFVRSEAELLSGAVNLDSKWKELEVPQVSAGEFRFCGLEVETMPPLVSQPVGPAQARALRTTPFKVT